MKLIDNIANLMGKYISVENKPTCVKECLNSSIAALPKAINNYDIKRANQ